MLATILSNLHAARRLAASAVVVSVVLACTTTESSRLKDGLASPQALGEAVITALNLKDKDGLRAILVTKQEYIDHLWDAFPASEHWPADFAYGNLNKNSTKGINRWSERLGSKDLAFVGIRFERPVEDYSDFKLHRGTVLHVRSKTGEEKELRILGSIVEMDKRYKLLSYDEG